MAAQVADRELVLDILLSVTRDGEYSHVALSNVLGNYQYLDKKSRAFITRVTEGTLERMIEIDYIINQFSKVKVHKMKPVIREIVRSAVYQLKYMDSVPDSAVCNEAVKLAAKRGFGGLKGFVNGLLRGIARNMDKISYPDPSDEAAYLSVTCSIPEWIICQWISDFGHDTARKMAQDCLERKPTTIRCHTSKITPEELRQLLESEGVKVIPVETLPYAFYIEGYDYLGALESFRKGCFSVQDVSSMMVTDWADPAPGDYVIDVCAAPGGKALHMADKLAGTGHVEARDLTEYKVNLIRENIERSGFANIEAVCRDATEFCEKDIQKADILVADLPCSGLGVIGRKTDLKYRMTPQMMESLAALQRQILETVAGYVRPGGKLIYSTCTVNKQENQENIKWFQAHFPKFELVREHQFLQGIDAGDGFYIAELRRAL